MEKVRQTQRRKSDQDAVAKQRKAEVGVKQSNFLN